MIIFLPFFPIKYLESATHSDRLNNTGNHRIDPLNSNPILKSFGNLKKHSLIKESYSLLNKTGSFLTE